jgi:hypothetical protein
MRIFRRNYFKDLIANAVSDALNASTVRKDDSLSFLGISHSENRNLNTICGWTVDPGYSEYWDMFKRSGYANRIIKSFPRSCWRDGATLKDGPPAEEAESAEEPNVILEDEMQQLTQLGIFQKLEQADILNRIGSFSVMYIGLPGESNTDVAETGKGGKLEDVFFAPYSQRSVTVNKYDQDPQSKRWGLPLEYTLTPRNDDKDSTSQTVDNRQTIVAHWSRVVHLAEGALDNGIQGEPALRSVFNTLEDYIKIRGMSSESFYRNCVQKFVLLTDEKLNPQAMANSTQTWAEVIDEAAQNFVNKQKDYLLLKGIRDIEFAEAIIADPKNAEMILIRELSSQTGMPQRLLTGEGPGQLAGNEDKGAWNQIINDRQNQWCAQWLTDALVILDVAGLINLPDSPMFVDWPVPRAMDELTESKVNLNDAQAKQAEAQADAIGVATGTGDAEQNPE